MTFSETLHRLRAFAAHEWAQLRHVNASDRLWQMPVAAALSSGLPLCVGAWFQRLDFGLISSLGGLVFIYTPNTRLTRRMAALMACGFGMTACFAFGLIAQQWPWARVPTLAFVATLATMLSRYFQTPPPGNFFYVLCCVMGLFTPTHTLDIPRSVGLMFMGCFLALAIAFFYSLIELRLRDARSPKEPMGYDFDNVIFDALAIGLTIAASLALALAMQLERPYWVPVSCAAVMQGQTMRAVWTKQLHRIIGTTAGLALAFGVLVLPLDAWRIAAIIMVLTFCVETAIARHYGFAAMVVTPMTILMAEAARPHMSAPGALIEARFLDTVLGCAMGLAGAALIHRPALRAKLAAPLRRITDAVLERG